MAGFLLGFRKWTLAVIYLVIAVALLLAGKIPKEDWLGEVTKVVTAFMATNVGEHLLAIGKDWVAKLGDKNETES